MIPDTSKIPSPFVHAGADGAMDTLAVVLQQPEQLSLARLALTAPGAADVVVDIDYSGISTGTEKLLWSGRMPHFPGMGYPLVPGYESVGRVVQPSASRVGATSVEFMLAELSSTSTIRRAERTSQKK